MEKSAQESDNLSNGGADKNLKGQNVDIQGTQDEEEKKEGVGQVYFEWTEEMTSNAEKVLAEDENPLSKYWYDKLESEAGKNWNIFYQRNQANFFKDRHYILKEFPELRDTLASHGDLSSEKKGDTPKVVLFDPGCGVGNAFFPIIEKFPEAALVVHACDFAKEAVRLIKEHQLYQEDKVQAFQCDLVNDEIPFEHTSADFALLLFVLSAISPENFATAVWKISQQLKSGAVLFFRDYGKYDLAMLRLAKHKKAKLKDNFYMRTDKTRAYYFEVEELMTLFSENGFEVKECEPHYRVIENRKDKKVMHRVWIQAKFVKV